MLDHPDPEPDRTTAVALRGALEDLRRYEPVFHGPRWADAADREALVDAGFWEVGASGRRYSREYVMATVAQRPAADESDWETSEFHVRATGASTYLLTYTLAQGERLTRRLSVWKRRENRWSLLFHQGTVVVESADS